MSPVIEIQDRSHYKEGMKRGLTIDPRRTVVLTVDMQREYLDLEVAGSPVLPEEAERVLKHAEELLDFARQQGIPVIHVYTTRRQVELDRGWEGSTRIKIGRALRLSQIPHAPARNIPDRLEGSPQSQVPARLVKPGDIHIPTKKTMDSYFGTELDLLLQRALKPETVVLTGINTDTCVYATTFATSCHGYQPVVISDCVASMRGKDSHQMALELMARSIAWVLTVGEFKAKVLAGAQTVVA